ncbi:MAG: hypothetical protein K0S32_4059 [Bacteroidetes bacterium]|nr:hypothetical protein [Bacteroidota bacterium]
MGSKYTKKKIPDSFELKICPMGHTDITACILFYHFP